STDPSQVRAMEKAVDIAKTLFIVSSKSGGTTEPNAMKDYFYDRVAKAVGKDKAGHRFIAVTDPGSSLEKVAAKQGFARTFDGEPIGEVSAYGKDRFFIDLRIRGEDDADHDRKLAALETAEHPVVRIVLQSVDYLGQEFFRFEMATAVAGAILGINPFNQPDV